MPHVEKVHAISDTIFSENVKETYQGPSQPLNLGRIKWLLLPEKIGRSFEKNREKW